MRHGPDLHSGSGADERDTSPAGGQGSRVSDQNQSRRIAELFECHNRALIRFLTYRLKSSQEAKEVAQEAYVRMLQLDALNGVSYLRAFLFKTAANLATDRLKSVSRRGRIDQLEFFESQEMAPSAEANVAVDQELAAVSRAIEELSPKCRYAFIMNRCYGYELAEVAKLMNLSERMVRIYVERALVFCRERLLGTRGGDV